MTVTILTPLVGVLQATQHDVVVLVVMSSSQVTQGGPVTRLCLLELLEQCLAYSACSVDACCVSIESGKLEAWMSCLLSMLVAKCRVTGLTKALFIFKFHIGRTLSPVL